MLTKKTKEQIKTIGFRLSAAAAKELEKRASRSGKTPGELAREIVIKVLEDENGIDLLKVKVASLESEIKQLRRGLSNTAEALLVVSGKVDKEQAKQWVKENIG